MTHCLLWLLTVLAVFGGSQARYENCEIPPAVEHASIDTQDDDEAVHAIYHCDAGYELQGPRELLCSLDTDIWNTDPPICVQVEASSEVTATEVKPDRQNKRKKLLDIIEDTSIPEELVPSLDMSCAQARIEAPPINNGVLLKYEARRRGERVFLVALYTCDENYEFEDAELSKLYCSHRQWVGETPSCMVLGEYTEEDGDSDGDGDGEGDEYDEVGAFEEEGPDNDEFEESQPNGVDESNQIVPPPPPPPSQPVEMGAEDVESVEQTNEIPTNVDAVPNEIEVNAHEEPAATDVNIVVEPTRDPYTPRVLDDNCGPDKGGCEQKCERLLFPGENEPRLKCSCEPGYSLDPYDYSSCHDIDECQLNNGGCEQICNNLPGSFQCGCEEGLKVDPSTERTCVDIDECQDPEVIAACAGGCENTYGSYHCTPALNAREDAVNESTQDEDEDDEDEGIVRTKEVVESAANNCPAGYRAKEGSDQCADIDECSEGTSGCDHCVNVDGSFECTCPAGFNLADDERTCVDINECQIIQMDDDGGEFRQPCMRTCINTPGSFVCSCNDNEHLAADGRNCLADSCQDLKNPQMNKTRCAFQCIDLPSGVYECICPEGYKLSDDLHDCEVVENGCAKEDGYKRCAPGTCVSSEDNQSFSCACPAGYENEAFGCKDVDECTTGAHECSHDCFNTEGSYHCACPGGYRFAEGSEHRCEDIDECQTKLDLCGALQCVNLPGEFKCVCSDGTEPNAETGLCSTVDPCTQSRCSHACVAESSTYKCICPEGMSLAADGFNCAYPNPCSRNNNGCQHICSSEKDGACSCESGYELGADGKSCIDIDECQIGNGGCEQECRNLPGSYSCVCGAGFELAEDRLTCLDIDECKRGQHECSHDCINIDGGFKCGCPNGYLLGENKVTCLDVDECDGAAHGCSHGCINKAGSYECTCPSSGLQLSDDRRTCIPSGVECPEGKVLDTKSNECVVADVCQSNNGGCSHICTAGLGCSCPSGLTLGWDGKTCEDIDECTVNNGDCSHLCRNSIGSYQCLCPDGTPALHGKSCASECPAGYKQNPLNPSECIDVDECATPGICQFNCVNKEGSYECACPRGYQLVNGRECEDINECLVNNGGCVGGECVNHNAGFECRCPLGQQLAADRRTCEKRTELRDLCSQFVAPANGEIHCTKYRHKKKLFYNTRCKVGCKAGYKLEGPEVRFCNASGQWDNFENHCRPVSCPRLAPPQNGALIPATCAQGHILPGQRCQLRCQPGFVPLGKSVAVCTNDLNWSVEGGQLACTPLKRTYPGVQLPPVRLPGYIPNPFNTIAKPPTLPRVPHFNFGGVQQPFIKCPRNTTVFLNHGEQTAHIILQKPLTNLDFRYIESSPPWTKSLQTHLPVGRYVVTFRGRDPASGRQVGCQTVITVRRSEAPKVLYCTPSFEVTLGVNQAYRSVVWEEPRFEIASSGLKKLYKSRLPGELFGAGIHPVYYEATNAEGRSARCEFKINVKTAPPVVAPHVPHIDLKFPNVRPVQPPVMNQAEKLLMPGHESYVICPGQAPVKVTQSQPVSLPVGCILKNIRKHPGRQFIKRRLLTPQWTSF